MARSEPSVQDANKALVRGSIGEVLCGNLDIVDEVISEDSIGVAGPSSPSLPTARPGANVSRGLRRVAAPTGPAGANDGRICLVWRQRVRPPFTS